MGEWPEYPLETFVDPERSICYGIVQPGKPQEDGVPIVRVNNFKEGHIDARDALKIDPEIENKYQRSRLRGGELLLTLVGSMGLSAIVPDELRGWNVARAVGVVPLKENVDKRWLNFVLRSQPSQDFIQTHANTTVQATFNLTDLARLPIPMPPDGVRLPASQLLSALDDKIELNRRMNETLLAMARALFKSWFVDFDPVRAKMEGRDPGLPKHIADIFPPRLVDSELGGIPEGWEVKAFADTVEIIGGGTPKTSVAEYWDGDIPWFSVVDAPAGSEVWVIDTEKKVTNAGVENSSTRILPVGTTILSARGTVGRIALVGTPMAMNQSCYGLRGRSGPNGFFTYFSTRQLVSRLQQHAHGSVFDTITRETLKRVPLVMPTGELIEAFEMSVDPHLERIRTTLMASRTLTKLRDTLLPKLISGELRVKDAEPFIGKTT